MVKSTHILAWQHEVVFAAMVGRIPFVNDLLMLPCICFAATMGHHDIVFAAIVGHGGVVQCFVDALFNVVSLSEGVPLINVIFFWLGFVDALLMLPCILLTLPIPVVKRVDGNYYKVSLIMTNCSDCDLGEATGEALTKWCLQPCRVVYEFYCASYALFADCCSDDN
ncbi:hypothetical protein Tco_1240592 [Tanacetum coccineum]